MLGSKEEPYPGRVLNSFVVILIKKRYIFLRFMISADISVLLILALAKFGSIIILLK